MKVVIIDYGMGNLGSVRRAFEDCGANELEVCQNPSALDDAGHVVLPGVGAFAQGMRNLESRGWIGAIGKAVLERHIALLGICLGMQLLADRGLEGGQVQGLGFIPGEVERLQPKGKDERVPHVGWNEVHWANKNPLSDGIVDATDFYFVHSYHFVAKDRQNVVGTTPYCGEFASVVAKDKIFGVQFHPEKSQRAGFQIIQNFLRA